MSALSAKKEEEDEVKSIDLTALTVPSISAAGPQACVLNERSHAATSSSVATLTQATSRPFDAPMFNAPYHPGFDPLQGSNDPWGIGVPSTSARPGMGYGFAPPAAPQQIHYTPDGQVYFLPGPAPAQPQPQLNQMGQFPTMPMLSPAQWGSGVGPQRAVPGRMTVPKMHPYRF